MTCSYDNFLHNVFTCEDNDAFYKTLCKTVDNLGFDKIIYLYDPDPSDTLSKSVQLTTYDPKWMEYWTTEGYGDIDIGVRKTAEQGLSPLTLDVDEFLSQPQHDEDPTAFKAFWEANTEGGCGKIFSHQLFQNQEGRGAMGLVSGHLSGHDFNKIVDEKGILLSSIIPVSYTHLTLPTICSV